MTDVLALEGLEAALRRAEERETADLVASLPVWSPQPGPQTEAWNCDCDEILYGGEPGGGKSALAAALPLQYIEAPRARLLVLRRNTTHLAELIDEAKDVFMRGNAVGSFKYRPASPENTRFREDKSWLLIDGGRVRVWFGHCDDANSWQIYHGQAFDRVVFDEVTQFEEEQYVEIRSRIRGKVPGLRRGSLATANPPKPTEPGAVWVRRRWGPWLDAKWELADWKRTDSTGAVVEGHGLPRNGSKPPAPSGLVLYVARAKDGDLFSTEPFVWDGSPAQTRTFIRAKLSDNKALAEGDPGYRGRLMDNDPVRAKQLLEGDWMISYSKGEMFQRARFEPVDEVPPGQRVSARAWDFAATLPSESNKDPDWTVGLRGCKHADGYYYITHVFRMRNEPGEVDAKRDYFARSDGREVAQLYPRDPAAAGKAVVKQQVASAINAGVDAHEVPTATNKVLKAGPVSAAAHPRALGRETGYGKIRVVRGDWNDAFFDILEAFPKGKHDDDVDALADWYNYLSEIRLAAPPPPDPGMTWASAGRGFR